MTTPVQADRSVAMKIASAMKDQNDNDQHSLDLLEELVDDRGEGQRQGDGDEEYRGDDGNGALARAEDEREHSAALEAHPGMVFGRIAPRAKTINQPTHMRLKPVTAVSPVTNV